MHGANVSLPAGAGAQTALHNKGTEARVTEDTGSSMPLSREEALLNGSRF